MMARLTGMEVSNASMYDGSTATAEAAMMACAIAKKADKVLVSETVDPKIVAVMDTYAHYQGIQLVHVPQTNVPPTCQAAAAAHRGRRGRHRGAAAQLLRHRRGLQWRGRRVSCP
jgi:glycine cleavage system pyridoxal-binding protein P